MAISFLIHTASKQWMCRSGGLQPAPAVHDLAQRVTDSHEQLPTLTKWTRGARNGAHTLRPSSSGAARVMGRCPSRFRALVEQILDEASACIAQHLPSELRHPRVDRSGLVLVGIGDHRECPGVQVLADSLDEVVTGPA
jgi:hypothetical protein